MPLVMAMEMAKHFVPRPPLLDDNGASHVEEIRTHNTIKLSNARAQNTRYNDISACGGVDLQMESVSLCQREPSVRVLRPVGLFLRNTRRLIQQLHSKSA